MRQTAANSIEHHDILVTIADVMNKKGVERLVSNPNALFNYIEITPSMAAYMKKLDLKKEPVFKNGPNFKAPINDDLSAWEVLVEAICDPEDPHNRKQLANLAKAGSYRLRYRRHKTEGKEFILNLLQQTHIKLKTDTPVQRLSDLFFMIWRDSSTEGQYRLYDIKNEKQNDLINIRDSEDLIRQSAALFSLDVIATNGRYQTSNLIITDRNNLARFVEIYEFFRAWSDQYIEVKRLNDKQIEKWISSLNVHEIKEIYKQHIFTAGKTKPASITFTLSKTEQMIRKLIAESSRLNFGSTEALAYHALKHLKDIKAIHPNSITSIDRAMVKYLETARSIILKGQGQMRPAQWEQAWIGEFVHDFVIDYKRTSRILTMKTLVKCLNDHTPIILTCFGSTPAA